MRNSKNLILLALVVVLLGGVFYYLLNNTSQPSGPKACTEEAKLCPDGSYVGRVGPKCEFAACPEVKYQWESASDSQTGIAFKYPKDLMTEYITPQDWPPKVSFENGEFSCPESYTQTGPKVIQRIIDGRTFCITTSSEGAAGSTYTEYTYKTMRANKVLSINFVLRYPQCLNYDDPRKTDCQKEQAEFNVIDIVNQVVNSISGL